MIINKIFVIQCVHSMELVRIGNAGIKPTYSFVALINESQQYQTHLQRKREILKNTLSISAMFFRKLLKTVNHTKKLQGSNMAIGGVKSSRGQEV